MPGSSRPSRRLQIRRAIAFAVGSALPAWLLLDGGGFDVVVRQQFALAGCWLLAVALFAGLLPRSKLDRSLGWPAALLAALIIWTVLSITWTESDERTFEELTRLVSYVALTCAVWLSLSRHTFRAAAAGISSGALFVCALAVFSRLAPSGFPSDEIAVVFDNDRLNYPLDYWNAVAALGTMSMAMALVWSAHARSWALRGAAGAAVPVAALAVYLTYSRAGAVGAALALILALVLSRNRWTLAANATVSAAAAGVLILVVRDQPAIAAATGGEGGSTVAAVLLLVCAACGAVAAAGQRVGLDDARFGRIHRAIPITAAVAAAAIGAVALAGPASGAWDSFLSDDTVAESARGSERLTTLGGDRDELWGSAIDAFSANTVNGIGPGSFEYWWIRKGSDQGAPVEDAHSLYLETMAELGLVGVLLLMGALVALLVVALQVRSRLARANDIGGAAAMIAAFGVFAFHAGVDWIWEYPSLAVIGLGGIAVATSAGQTRARGLPLRGRARIAAGFLALAAGAIQIPGIVSTERVRESERALAAGDVAGARTAADDAVKIQPWAASALGQRALAAEAEGDLDAAREDLMDARERESTNWLWPAQLVRIELALGNERAAAKAAADARALNGITPEGVPSVGGGEAR